MPKSLFRFLWTFVPVFFGIFLPYFEFPNGSRLVSLFWAVVFGISDYITYPIHYDVLHPFPVLPFVAIGWPMIVAVLLFWFSGVAWARTTMRERWIAVVTLLILCSPMITLARAQQPPFNHWPTYQNVMASIW
jgi:hypothetical protein